MTDGIKLKLGPPWARTVIDPGSRTIKFGLRTKVPFDQVKRLRVREYFTHYEEYELLNANPPVEKAPRPAELWADTSDGKQVKVGELDQAGLLLSVAADAARLLGVPVETERTHVVPQPNGR